MQELHTTRRNFLKVAAASGAGLAVAGSVGQPGIARAEDASTEDSGKKLDVVPRKKLGTTGDTIPILLVGGAMKFDPQYDKVLHRAYKGGANYIDTALVYARGQSHKTIAPFIKQIGDRKKLWITSKAPSNNATVESYTRGMDTCLDQLETDYLDMFFMHMIKDEKYLDPEYLAMGDKLRKSGKTRYFGFSCHDGNVVELMEKAARVGGIDAIMFRYHFGKYGDVKLNKAIDNCKKAGIGLIAMKTQNSVPEDQEKVVEFKSENFTLAQAKLKAVWADERIDAAVSHMDNTDKLAQNMAAAMSPMQLTMGEFQQLQRIATATSCVSCQGCNQICESRVSGDVKIADQLRYLMYDECYGETDKARQYYRAMPTGNRAIAGIDFTEASKVCPQGIDIAARLAVAQSRLG